MTPEPMLASRALPRRIYRRRSGAACRRSRLVPLAGGTTRLALPYGADDGHNRGLQSLGESRERIRHLARLRDHERRGLIGAAWAGVMTTVPDHETGG